jgi:cellulose synthase/poly-beta-1,6-N-acetylglucosamine synthase-like glycosyltransferase
MYGTVTLSMINTDPLLSVVMPVYNERTTIEAIVRRALALTLRLELIVVDVLLKYRFVE